MSRRMLIDGIHPEETRVVVTGANRLDEYDIETSTKTQLKGNIYLAKITRVEPSLQAAFVDYGGNRHGFLAFSEIHPDYYQIPIEDREALKADQAELEGKAMAAQAHLDEIDGELAGDENPTAEATANGEDADGEPEAEAEDETAPESAESAESADEEADADAKEKKSDGRRTGRRRNQQRRYNIQEVIRRRQVLLVQVVKEERGNKGAALTTYLSLAGRYCVLMPNAARGGGISRKITNTADRKRLKDLLNDLKLPEGMGVIMRTAGMERNKSEIRRDFDYLMRAWEDVRELTLKSAAPMLVYEEGNLIKRAIRDLYSRDIEEVWIEGDEAYQTAKKFMRLMMPSHAKRVQPYRDTTIPLFHRYQVEGQIEAMHNPVVHLKSGAYIVINVTEALVAVDVNSGRATRERNIEETALKTNLEAASEIARQLRLRDMAGLIVIDFIDMEENRNQRAVEKRIKEATKADRARIRLGRISPFGLFEMSRQRLRPSLIETSTSACPHCHGSGRLRSTESTAVHVLRAIEEEGIRKRSSDVSVAVPTEIALYILNQKRAAIAEIESRHGFRVTVTGDDTLIPPDMRLERVRAKTPEGKAPEGKAPEGKAEVAPAAEAAETAETEPGTEQAAQEPTRRKRTRRRRRKADAGDAPDAAVAVEEVAEAAAPAEGEAAPNADQDAAGERPAAKRRRRGRRGGRRRNRGQKSGDDAAAETASAETTEGEAAGPDTEETRAVVPAPDAEEIAAATAAPEPPDDASGNGEAAAPDEPEAEIPAEVIAEPDKTEPRRGWWQR